jgi:hypothetical protein
VNRDGKTKKKKKKEEEEEEEEEEEKNWREWNIQRLLQRSVMRNKCGII